MDKVESKRKIRQLVESFWQKHGLYNAYSEQDTATKWIKPLLGFLGWDLFDLREVREGVKIDLHSGKQRFFDCVLYSRTNSEGTKEYIIIEFKRLGAGFLHKKINAVKKLTDNAKETDAKYAVITRFDETIIYDAKTGEEKVFFKSPNDYLSKFEILWNYLAKPS